MDNFEEKEEDKKDEDIIKFFIFLVCGLVIPIFLIPLVLITGNSEIIEELARGLVIFFIVKNFASLKKALLIAVLFGFFFAMTENFFYLSSMFSSGNEAIFYKRLVFTTLLHIFTAMVIFLSASLKKWLIFAGILAAIVIHLSFNYFITLWL